MNRERNGDSFRDLSLPKVLDTSRHDFVRDFFRPILGRAVKYDRGVGFFSSGWLRANAQGLTEFAKNRGTARFLTSPILDRKDWEALRQGDQARTNAILRKALEIAVDDLRTSLEEDVRVTLAWLVADGILEFKLAVPRANLQGEFHDKFGIFSDSSGDKISFNGSYNDSLQGLRNYESIKVFRSWDSAGSEHVEDDEARFQRLWEDRDANVATYKLDAAVTEKILKLRDGKPPPYRKSSEDPNLTVSTPGAGIEIRPYQRNAIATWFAKGGKGIFEMATGTGKTLTAITLARTLAQGVNKAGKPLLTVIICPYQHLVSQWLRELGRFGIDAVPCFQSRDDWRPTLNEQLQAAEARARLQVWVVTTNATFRGTPFQSLLTRTSVNTLIVADEVHNMGSDLHLRSLPNEAAYRLGLSATPNDKYDEDRTKNLLDYFGGVVFQFGLGEAIAQRFLSPYDYHPIVVRLEPDELDDYLDLSAKISKRSLFDKTSQKDDDVLTALLMRRARLVANAKNKLPALRDALQREDLTTSRFNLFYCGDGRVGGPSDDSERRQIEAVTRLIGNELGMLVARYTAETPNEERSRILADFASGRLQGVVAIRCLDEGVDVPATRRAFILASSSNPRQFIQRRGRVLRLSPAKDKAEIWDFIVVPPAEALRGPAFGTERRLVERELERVVEFARLAANGPQAEAILLPVKKEYNLLHL